MHDIGETYNTKEKHTEDKKTFMKSFKQGAKYPFSKENSRDINNMLTPISFVSTIPGILYAVYKTTPLVHVTSLSVGGALAFCAGTVLATTSLALTAITAACTKSILSKQKNLNGFKQKAGFMLGAGISCLTAAGIGVATMFSGNHILKTEQQQDTEYRELTKKDCFGRNLYKDEKTNTIFIPENCPKLAESLKKQFEKTGMLVVIEGKQQAITIKEGFNVEVGINDNARRVETIQTTITDTTINKISGASYK